MLIKNVRILSDGQFRTAEVRISDGRITAVGQDVPSSGTSTADEEAIDGEGLLLVSGFVDVHVHFREPGFSYKETIRSGSMAAAHGGYTTVCTMPNLRPAPDCPENLKVQTDIIRRDAMVHVLPYATITKGQKGSGELTDYAAFKEPIAGFSDDGRGVQSEDLMREAMKRILPTGKMVVEHCEVEALLKGGYIHDGKYAREHGHPGICSRSEWEEIARNVRLSEETGCPFHACHISTKESVQIIREAKARGLNVSCETAPHYLTLCEDDLQEDARFKMNPPLRTAADREALIRGIQDGTIDIIATDHAPHSAEEKSRGLRGSCMGITGLETAFPILYSRLVMPGIISLQRLMELLSDNPRTRFKLGGGLKAGEPADLTLLDLDKKYKIDSSTFLSLGHSTPFDGWEVQGEVAMTMVDGKVVYKR